MIAAKSHKVQGLESIIMLIIIGLLIKKFILTPLAYCRKQRMVLISSFCNYCKARV